MPCMATCLACQVQTCEDELLRVVIQGRVGYVEAAEVEEGGAHDLCRQLELLTDVLQLGAIILEEEDLLLDGDRPLY
jgi:hypothetical protein